jgi:hypothetical protein
MSYERQVPSVFVFDLQGFAAAYGAWVDKLAA